MKLCRCSTLSHQFSLHQLSYIVIDSSHVGPSANVLKILALNRMVISINGAIRRQRYKQNKMMFNLPSVFFITLRALVHTSRPLLDNNLMIRISQSKFKKKMQIVQTYLIKKKMSTENVPFAKICESRSCHTSLNVLGLLKNSHWTPNE